MTPDEELKKGVSDALTLIVKKSREKLLLQGHKATGELINSLGGTVEKINEDFVGSFWMKKYGIYQDTGIDAKRIAYNEGSGASRSLYIEGLIRWIIQKGFESDAKKVKGMAFAIAKTHKLKGMHTTDGNLDPSKRNWLTSTLEENEKEVVDIITKASGRRFDIVLQTIIDKANNDLKN